MKYTHLIEKINTHLDSNENCSHKSNLVHARNLFRYESKYCKTPDTKLLKDLAVWVLDKIAA